MPVLIAKGQQMDREMFFLSFLYSCLNDEIQWQIALFEAPQVPKFIPPDARAVIDETTAMCPPYSLLSRPFIIRAGVKQLTFIMRLFQFPVVQDPLLGITMPALQTNRSILSNYFLISSITAFIYLSLDRSTFLKIALHFNFDNQIPTASNKSSLRSIINIVGAYFLANSRAICFPIPIHPPVIIIKVDQVNSSFLRGQQVQIMCVRMVVIRAKPTI